MLLHRFTLALLAALSLTACASPRTPGTPTVTPVAQAPTSAPTQPPAATQPPPPTSVPTQPPAATQPPPPTDAPTQPPPATEAPPAPTSAPTQPLVATEAPPAPTQPSASTGQELLFLRAGDLWAYALATGDERKIAPGVRDFAASPDGALIALVRDEGQGIDLWS
ncbi:MAG TPA: hypothetical protein VFO07_12390, partial [Roseiflexaceae bacterium]|nr:hypothetical protein [Roseiflexaceae bacterium]